MATATATASHIEFYSQPATMQDQWVVEKTEGRVGGYYVEIGAHDGKRHSNTLTLEQSFGWKGLLVEPNPNLFEKLVSSRSHARNQFADVAIGPSNKSGENFALGDAYGGLTRYMSQQWLDGHEFHQSPITQVDTITLQSLFEAYKVPEYIDYLSLDVEGAELAILESFFKCHHSRHYRIRYMTVEFLYDRVVLDKLERLLEPEYVLDRVQAFDAFFVHRSLT
jgi:FkbM family methyltransferase